MPRHTPEPRAGTARIRVALALLMLLGAPVAARAQWTQTSGKASAFGDPGDPLLDPSCAAATSGTTFSTATMRCSGAGYTAYGFAEAATSGILRAGTSFDLDAFNATTGGGMYLGNGKAAGAAAYAFFGNTITAVPNGFGATPATISVWVKLDGTIASTTGTWQSVNGAPYPLVGPVHQNFANLHIWNSVDGFRDLFVDWTQVGTTTGSQNSRFVGTYSPAPAGTSAGPSVVASVDGWALFSNIPLVGGQSTFYMSLQTLGLYGNWYGGTDVVYAGARSATGFENTAYLARVQAFDALGNDVTGAYTFQLASGEIVSGGDPTVTPEPASWMLVAAGLAMLGAGGRRRRQNA
jgi:hypothetical protein